MDKAEGKVGAALVSVLSGKKKGRRKKKGVQLDLGRRPLRKGAGSEKPFFKSCGWVVV